MGIREYLRDGWLIVKFPSPELRQQFLDFVGSLATDLETATKHPGGIEARAITEGTNLVIFRYDDRYKLSGPDVIKYHKGVVLPMTAQSFEN